MKDKKLKKPNAIGKTKTIGWPVILITIGIIFLLQNFGIVDDAWSKLWPLILISYGAVKMIEYFSSR